MKWFDSDNGDVVVAEYPFSSKKGKVVIYQDRYNYKFHMEAYWSKSEDGDGFMVHVNIETLEDATHMAKSFSDGY